MTAPAPNGRAPQNRSETGPAPSPRDALEREVFLLDLDARAARIIRGEHQILNMRELRAFAELYAAARANVTCASCHGHPFHLLSCLEFQHTYAARYAGATP